MAFPGMSAPGLGGQGVGLDEQKLKEQQMIKFVRTLFSHRSRRAVQTDREVDATSHGVMSGKDCNVGCHGLWSGWSFRSVHVQCKSTPDLFKTAD